MSPQRPPYARRSVSLLVAILSIIVVIGFAAAGYEINHQRTEVNGLHSQVNGLQNQVQQLNGSVIYLGVAVKQLAQQGK